MKTKKQSAEDDSREQLRETTLLHGLRPKLFEGLSPGEITAIVGAARERRFAADQVLQQEGETASHLSLLVMGHAAFYKTTPQGGKLFIRWISPGDAFGLAALLQVQQPFVITIQAFGEGSLLVWDRASAQALTLQIPRLIKNTYTIVGEFATLLADALAHCLSQTAQQRLARVLLESARDIGRNRKGGIEVDLTNEHLAQMADVSMFTASRQLSQWQSEGIVVKSRCKILLRTLEPLVVLVKGMKARGQGAGI